MGRTFANPPPTVLGIVPVFRPNFNMGVRVGNIIYTTGIVAIDEEGNPLFPDDLPAQTRCTMEYLKQLVIELGATMDDVVSLSNYYDTSEGWPEVARIQAQYFHDGTALSGVAAGVVGPHFVLESELIAVTGESKSFADPTGHYAPLGGRKFHQGVRCGDLIYVAGQVALDSEGRVLNPGDMPAQTRVVMENIKRVLSELDASLGDIVSMKTYYVGNDGWKESVRARADYFQKGPSNTSVRVSSLMLPDLLIQIEAVAMIGAPKTHVNPPRHYSPTEPSFHHGVRSGNMVYVGGQLALDADGKVLYPGDMVRQTGVVMENLKHVVEALGASMDDVVHKQSYLIGRENWHEVVRIRSSYFKKDVGPTSRGMIFEGLPHPDLKIAIEAVAIVDELARPTPASLILSR